ncbi:MAG: histidine phosphatase family protein [Candidatus Thiodiazotropha sp.]
MNDRTVIDLLRHGEPAGGRRYRGQVDDPLSEQGWREMWHAVSAEQPWQVIISSPLRRCSEFARQLSNKLTLPLYLDERLKEVGFGTWEGKTASQIRQEDAAILSRFYHDPVNNRPDGAEPLTTFNQRIAQALEEATAAHRGKHVLIIAHAGVIRGLITQTLRAPSDSMYRLSITTASLSRIQIDNERPPTVLFVGRRRLSSIPE